MSSKTPTASAKLQQRRAVAPGRLDADLIENVCGSGAFRRGFAYYRRDRVIEATLTLSDDGQIELRSRVRGSASTPYRQHIVFSDRRPYLSGECSCPVGGNCKHVAATLLALLDQLDDGAAAVSDPAVDAGADRAQSTPLERWRGALAADPQTPRPPPPAGGECLLYLLSPQNVEDRTAIVLEFLRTRRRQDGGYSRRSSRYYPTAAYSPYGYGGYYRSAHYLTDDDDDILRRLPLLDAGHSACRLAGEDGALLLRRLLASGRCHLLDPGTPALRQGPALTPQLVWHDAADGRRRLDISVPTLGDDWLCCPTEPAWYIDPRGLRAGPLLTELGGERLDLLRRLPPPAADELEPLARLLLRTLPRDSVPLPVPLPIICVDQTEPTPRLTLDGDHAGGYRARLSFDYQGVVLAPLADELDAERHVTRRGSEYRIRQQPQAEAAALTTLLALDLRPVDDPEPLPAEPLADHDPPRCGLAFAFDAAGSAAALCWARFLDRDRPRLERQGWRIDLAATFSLRIVDGERWQSRLNAPSGQNWFELSLAVHLGGQRVELLPLLTRLLAHDRDALAALLAQPSLLLQVDTGAWLRLPSAQVEPLLAILIELYDDRAPAADAAALRLDRRQAPLLIELERRLAEQDRQLHWQGGKVLRRLGERLRDFTAIETVAAPAALRAELRCYQQRGLDWLQFLRRYEFGGILADDMGLGKTVQTLAHLLVEKKARRLRRPALVIVPTSLLGNWQREAARFAPTLRVLVLHGPKRRQRYDQIERSDLVLSTYPLLARDRDFFTEQRFHSVVLDEAQTIKNPRSKAARAACALNAGQRLCLSGTPLENHLGELWSLFHFLMPGFLGDETRFNRLFRHPIERRGSVERGSELARRIRPFMLRRTKQQVAAELPAKTEILQTVALDGKQAALYETIRVAMADRVRRLLAQKSLARSRIDILDALLKLRQTCCDPRLVPLDAARGIDQSAKLSTLNSMLGELLEAGHKVLIFSQFTRMLELIENELQRRAVGYRKLTGRTRHRDEVIAAFQDGEVPVFLVSLKAGGVGLNLTAADCVIIYDPWWNPAVEQQAIDRAHRIGQHKPVFVYKLIAADTVEEKILELQRKKRELADGVYDGGAAETLSADELLALFQPLQNV